MASAPALLTPASLSAVRPRLLGTLLAAQICGSTGHSITLAIGSIVAAEITGSNTWSGVPVGMAALGAALSSLWLSRMMARLGRRRGLALGYQLAVLGSGLSMAGAIGRSFPLLLLGMFLFGIGQRVQPALPIRGGGRQPGHPARTRHRPDRRRRDCRLDRRAEPAGPVGACRPKRSACPSKAAPS